MAYHAMREYETLSTILQDQENQRRRVHVSGP